MRQHGVNVPDPVPNSDWGPEPADGTRGPGWDAAWQSCRQLLPAGMVREGEDNPPRAQELEALRAYAGCMRAHDIDMSDPRPDGNVVIGGRLENVTRAQVENDPGYKAAHAACRDKLPNGPRWGGGNK